MDHSNNRWTELQQQQHSLNQFYNPTYPPPPPPPPSSSSYTHYPYHPPRNPNPSFTDPQTLTNHIGVIQEANSWQPDSGDSYSTMFSYPSYASAEALAQTTLGYAQYQQNQDYSVGVTQSWAAKQGAQQHHYVAEPVTYSNVDTKILDRPEPVLSTLPNPIYWNNPVLQPVSGAKRKFPKKAKIVQSAWCEICKIDCTSSDVLNQHRLGKKHKKNLENLTGNVTAPAAPMVNNPVIGKKENKSALQQSKKKDVSSREDLETKKRKIVQEGAAAEAVRVCTICNVACNSEIVFHYHLTGQKHAAMVKKHATSTTAAPVAQAITAV